MTSGAYPTSTANNAKQLINRRVAATSDGFMVDMDVQNKLRFTTGAGANVIVTPTALPTNEWHHIIATFKDNTARLYVNGVLKAEKDYGTAVINLNPGLPIKMGAAQNEIDKFTGYMDEVVIRNKASDNVGLSVRSANITEGSTEVSVHSIIELQYSQHIGQGDHYAGIELKAESVSVPANIMIEGLTLRLVPLAPLTPLTHYEMSVPAGAVKGLADGQMADSFALGFTTNEEAEPEQDTLAPVWPQEGKLEYSNLGKHSVSLQWTAATDDVGVAEYKLSWNGGSVAVAGDVLAKQVEELAAGTTYSFKVEARDAAGNWTTDGPSLSITTENEPPVYTWGGGGGQIVQEEPGTYTVKAEDVAKQQEDGKATLSIANDVNRIVIPAAVAKLLEHTPLTIQADKLILDVPAEALKSLLDQMADKENGKLVIEMIPLQKDEVNALLAAGAASGQPEVALAGDIYEIRLSSITQSGEVTQISKLNKPVVIRIKTGPDLNRKLAAIYFIADDGALEFIGGQYMNGEMVAEISHFSKYAILELRKTFADVLASHWAFDAIRALAAKHVVEGTTPATFEPDRTVTRAEFTAMLVRALELTAEGETAFEDVTADAWYAEPVAIAVQWGIVNGKSEAIFDPNGQITREEMVVMLMRAYAVLHGKDLNGYSAEAFADESDISAWALDAVRAAASLKLVNGRGANKFVPDGISTRAEAAMVIEKLLD